MKFRISLLQLYSSCLIKLFFLFLFLIEIQNILSLIFVYMMVVCVGVCVFVCVCENIMYIMLGKKNKDICIYVEGHFT